jgi:hypothetical protein
MRSRKDGAFSQRETVGCEHEDIPLPFDLPAEARKKVSAAFVSDYVRAPMRATEVTE